MIEQYRYVRHAAVLQRSSPSLLLFLRGHVICHGAALKGLPLVLQRQAPHQCDGVEMPPRAAFLPQQQARPAPRRLSRVLATGIEPVACSPALLAEVFGETGVVTIDVEFCLKNIGHLTSRSVRCWWQVPVRRYIQLPL